MLFKTLSQSILDDNGYQIGCIRKDIEYVFVSANGDEYSMEDLEQILRQLHHLKDYNNGPSS
jgi:hypothetical protein